MLELIAIYVSCSDDGLLTTDDLEALQHELEAHIGHHSFHEVLSDLTTTAATVEDEGHPDLAQQLRDFAADCERTFREEHHEHVSDLARRRARDFRQFSTCDQPSRARGFGPSEKRSEIPLMYRRI